MTRRMPGKLLAIAAVMSLACAVPAAGQRAVNPQAQALKGFTDRVKAYVDLQRKMQTRFPQLSPNDDPGKLEAHQRALADAIRQARADARQGDIFGDAANQFRRAIKEDAESRTSRDIRAAKEEVPQKTRPKVNMEYPEKIALATVPPLLLERLQRLPDGVEYRFMGRDLILRDSFSNLIVDVVPEAVPTARR